MKDKIQYGWKCPFCETVMAPWQETCVNCRGKVITEAKPSTEKDLFSKEDSLKLILKNLGIFDSE